MTPAEVLEQLTALEPDALLLEPREHFDAALVGYTHEADDHWPRQTHMIVAVYDANKCIEALMVMLGCDWEGAADYFGYNTAGAWVGEGTPTFRYEDDPDATISPP
jgi:hypothetical protein